MDALTKAIDAAGGVGKLAEAVGVTQTAVSNWRSRKSVPANYGAQIESASKGSVRRWELFPDDWHRIWPELIGADGAPAVPEAAKTA